MTPEDVRVFYTDSSSETNNCYPENAEKKSVPCVCSVSLKYLLFICKSGSVSIVVDIQAKIFEMVF